MKAAYRVAILFLVVPVTLIFLVLGFWRLLGVVLLCLAVLLADWGD